MWKDGYRMVREEQAWKYTGISIPKDYAETIDQYIAEDPSFNSRADFIKSAIREKIESSKISKNDIEHLFEKNIRMIKELCKKEYIDFDAMSMEQLLAIQKEVFNQIEKRIEKK